MSTYQNNHTPFLYAILWSDLNVGYVGVRYGATCHPSDLWKTYFTSSRFVNAFRAEHGEPDVVEVLRTFDCAQEAQAAEEAVLREFELPNLPCFLNKAYGIEIVWDDELRELVGRKAREAADRRSPIVNFNGTDVSLRELSRQYGIDYKVIKQRHAANLRDDDLVLAPGLSAKRFTYEGKRHTTASLAKLAGVTRQGMLLRLKRFGSVEAAVRGFE